MRRKMAKYAIFDHGEIIGYGEADKRTLQRMKNLLAPYDFKVEAVYNLGDAKSAEVAAEREAKGEGA
jgi:hypothetical protein